MSNKTNNCFSVNDFRAELARMGLTQKELCNKLNICETTLVRKIQKNGDFNAKEIREMISLFGKETTLNFMFSEGEK